MAAEQIMQISIQLTRVIVPMIIFIGTIGNSINIFILARPKLVRHPCSLYFLALGINNVFYCTVIMLINLLADGYQIDLNIHSSTMCKVLAYFLNFCPNASVYLIVSASVDRFCASSARASVRQFSSVRGARWTIGILLGILMFFFCGALISFELENIGILICTISFESLFNQIFFITNLVMYVLVAPLCMIIFGFLTIRNTSIVRINRERISRYRRTERQLSRMLLLQVGTHLILTLPFCSLFFTLILPIDFRYSPMFYPILIITKIPFYTSFTTAIFLYILSARAYRNELFQLLKWNKSDNRIHPTVHQNDEHRSIALEPPSQSSPT